MDLSNLLGKYSKPAATPTPEPVVETPKVVEPPVCDSCGADKPLTSLKNKAGKSLMLCANCHTTEVAALGEAKHEYQNWPKCSKCGAHTKEPIDGRCTNCQDKQPTKVDLVSFKTTDSSKYQEFFNQTTEMIVDMIKKYPTEQEALEDIKAFIVKTQEDIFSIDAELLRKRTAKQAASIKFNAILQKLSLDEQKKYKIDDSSFVASGNTTKRLANPLKDVDKKKKIRKSLDSDIDTLFRLKGMTDEEIAIAKKKIGL